MKAVIAAALIILSSAALAEPYTEALDAAEDFCEAVIRQSDYGSALERTEDLLDQITSEQRRKVTAILGKCGA